MYEEQLAEAIRHFGGVRSQQQEFQGETTGIKDFGSREAVTAGKHLDGFIALIASILSDSGLPSHSIHTRSTTLPGYFRPTKDWDLVVVIDDQLLASIEFKHKWVHSEIISTTA